MTMNLSLDDIRQKFRDCGLKSTPQRTAIYQTLVHSTAHPTRRSFCKGIASLPHAVPEHGVLHLGRVAHSWTRTRGESRP